MAASATNGKRLASVGLPGAPHQLAIDVTLVMRSIRSPDPITTPAATLQLDATAVICASRRAA